MFESVDPEYRRPIVSNLLAQLIVLPFGALILDGGYIFQRLVIAALLYWITVPLVYFQLVIPSRACLIWLKAGFAMTLCAMFVMGTLITWWQGAIAGLRLSIGSPDELEWSPPLPPSRPAHAPPRRLVDLAACDRLRCRTSGEAE